MARETQECAAAEMAETVRQVRGEEERAVVCSPADHDTTQLHDYEAQFFSFTPETCMMRVVDAFQESLRDMLLLVERVFVRNTELRAADGSEEEERLRTVSECRQKLQQILLNRFQRLEAKMKTVLTNNCFTIPTNVLLTEDEQHRKYPQDLQEVLRLESSIAELHRAYEAEVCGRQALLVELEEQKETQEILDGILKWMEETTDMTKEDGATGRLQGSIQQVKEAIKKLEDCVAEIYHKVSRGAK